MFIIKQLTRRFVLIYNARCAISGFPVQISFWRCNYASYLPAEKAPSQQRAWLYEKNEYKTGQTGSCPPQSKGQSTSFPLIYPRAFLNLRPKAFLEGICAKHCINYRKPQIQNNLSQGEIHCEKNHGGICIEKPPKW